MKKLFLATVFILAFVGNVFAAGTIVRDTTLPQHGLNGDRDTWIITYTVTWDAAAAAPDNIKLNDIVDSSGVKQYETMNSLAGWWLQLVHWNYGATPPKVDTDLYLWRVEDRIDILGGEGENAIDDTTTSTIFPLTQTRMLDGNELIDLDNNDVVNATGTLIFELYR